MWHRRILQIIIKWMCNVWRMLKLLLQMLKLWLCMMEYVYVVSVTYIFSWLSNIDADAYAYFKLYKRESKCNMWRMLKLLSRIKRNLMTMTYIYNYNNNIVSVNVTVMCDKCWNCDCVCIMEYDMIWYDRDEYYFMWCEIDTYFKS